jgi:hypothetical protein
MQKILIEAVEMQNLLHLTALIKYFAFHLSRCKISWISLATVGLVRARPLTWFAAIVAEIAATISASHCNFSVYEEAGVLSRPTNNRLNG